jgi:hypothetical protein
MPLSRTLPVVITMELKTGSHFRDWLPIFNQILDTQAIVLVPRAHFQSSCVGAVPSQVEVTAEKLRKV